MIRTKRFTVLAAAALIALLGTASGARAGEVSAARDAETPFLVKIHADWCGTCTRMEPTWEKIEAREGTQVRVVIFDVTDRASVARSREEADRLGLRAFFDEYRGRTGTAAVLHGATREPLEVWKGELDASVYESALAAARTS